MAWGCTDCTVKGIPLPATNKSLRPELDRNALAYAGAGEHAEARAENACE